MKRKALAITLAAAMAMGTCAVTASAADGDKYTIGICQLVQHEALETQLPLTSRTHRAIPTPVLQSLTASFPIMLT